MILVSPLILFTHPESVTFIPPSLLVIFSSPFALRIEPLIFTPPCSLVIFVSPLELTVPLSIETPFEPSLEISIFPAPKFLTTLLDAILTPPLLPYDVIWILPFTFWNSFPTIMASVLTSFWNKASA